MINKNPLNRNQEITALGFRADDLNPKLGPNRGTPDPKPIWILAVCRLKLPRFSSLGLCVGDLLDGMAIGCRLGAGDRGVPIISAAARIPPQLKPLLR
jgi:hypothetical protein